MCLPVHTFHGCRFCAMGLFVGSFCRLIEDLARSSLLCGSDSFEMLGLLCFGYEIKYDSTDSVSEFSIRNDDFSLRKFIVDSCKRYVLVESLPYLYLFETLRIVNNELKRISYEKGRHTIGKIQWKRKK